MAGFFKNAEAVVRDFQKLGLSGIMFYYGVDLKLFRADKDKYADVFGKMAGNKTDFLKNFVGALAGDDFFPSDDAGAGNFTEGFLYTEEQDINVGDVIEVDSADGRMRRYVVDSWDTEGTQDTVFGRWKIVNLA